MRAWMHFRTLLVVAGVLMLANAPPSEAREGGETVANAGLVAPNQGVSLEENASQAAEIDGESAGARTLDDQAAGVVDDQHDVGDADKVSKTADTLTIRRGSKTPRSADQVGAYRVAWYRRGMFPLVVVLGLVGGAYWAVRRWMPARRVAESGLLRIVAQTSIAGKHSVALIQLSRRFVLVGISSDRVEPLCTICDPEEVADLLTRIGSRSAAGDDGFSEMLACEVGGYADPVEEEPGAAPKSGERVSGASGQLAGLLGKLRTLQSK